MKENYIKITTWIYKYVGANAGNISQNSMCNDRVQCGRYSVHATRKILEALRSYFSLVQRGCQKNS